MFLVPLEANIVAVASNSGVPSCLFPLVPALRAKRMAAEVTGGVRGFPALQLPFQIRAVSGAILRNEFWEGQNGTSSSSTGCS